MSSWRRDAVLLGGAAERRSRAAGGPVLLKWTGEPFQPSPWDVQLLMDEAILPDGSPLFPDAPSPYDLIGERFEEETRPWRSMRPGPYLSSELAELDPQDLSDDGLVEAIRAHGRMVAHHEAQMSKLIAELASRPVYQQCDDTARHRHDAARVAASEVSLAMRWTPRHADARVAHAVRLVRELPATLAALDTGEIDSYRARVIDEETAPLAGDPELTRTVEAAAVRRAATMTGPALRAFVKRRVLTVAPDVAERRRRQARMGRRVDKPFAESDGMASMQVYGPVEDLAALFTAIDAAARARRDTAAKTGDTETVTTPLPALRFDVLADCGWTALSAGHLGCCAPTCLGAARRLGTQHGQPATVQVTVPFTTLAGLTDTPAELAGYGPITAEAARRIAGDATWRRLLTDPSSGALLDYGTTRYEPPQHLADHVIARDRTCRFPTCNWPAESSQLDHTVPYRPDGSGGPTAAHNLGALHARHHNDKTHHRFTITQPEPGQFVITTPAGLTYIVDPEIIGPVDDPPNDTRPDDDLPQVWDDEIDDPPPY